MPASNSNVSTHQLCWNEPLATGRQIFSQRAGGGNGTSRLALTPDGEHLIFAWWEISGRQRVRVWHIATGILRRSLLLDSSQIHDLAVHPLSGDVVVSGLTSQSWQLATRAPQWSLVTPVSQAGVFWGSEDVIIHRSGSISTLLPDGGTGQLQGTLPSLAGDGVVAAVHGDLAFMAERRSHGHQTLLGLLQRGKDSFSTLSSMTLPLAIRNLRISPDGKRFAAIGHIKDLITAETKPVKFLPRPDQAGVQRCFDYVWLSADRLLGCGTENGRGQTDAQEHFLLWDANTGKVLRDLHLPIGADRLALSPDGRTIAEGGEDRHIRLRDAATLEVQHDFRAHGANITALVFHPAKPILASASADLTVRLWNLDDLSLIEEFQPAAKPVLTLHFSPSGHRLAAADALGKVHVWELAE